MFASWNARAVGLQLDAESSIELAAAAGFEGVDLLVRDIVESGTSVEGLRTRMDELGLRGGAWPLPVHWRGSSETFEADLRRLPAFAEAAARLRLSRTGTWVMPETGMRALAGEDPARIWRATWRLHLDRLGRIAAVLADNGIELGLEIIGPASFRTGEGLPFITSHRQLDELLIPLRAGHPNMGILLDAFHLFAADEVPSVSAVPVLSPIVWVHVADPTNHDRAQIREEDRELPRPEGLSDVTALLESLRAMRYQGPVTAEPLGRCKSLMGLDALTVARKVRESLISVWPGSR